MPRISFFFLTLFFIAIDWTTARHASAKDFEICGHIKIRDGELRLDKNEKRLVCGESKLPAWREVPLKQAEYHLKIFLQNEGYFQPSFEAQEDVLFVTKGSLTKIRHWSLKGDTSVVERKRKRKVKRVAMTSTKLDEVEKWVQQELASNGYACSKVESRAKIWEENLETSYVGGPRQDIISQTREGDAEIDSAALKRFEAFEIGDLYDVRKLALTSNRLIAEGLIQSSYFTHECQAEGVALTHHLQVGKARILRFAVGASTEEFPFMDIAFRNTKLDNKASSLGVLLHASPLEQSLEFTSELYILPWTTSNYLGPRAKISREDEESFRVFTAKAGADIGRLWDWADHRWNLRGGPTFNYLNTLEGFGPDDVSYLSVEGRLTIMSHDYELLMARQIAGHNVALDYQGQREGLGSPLSVDRIVLKAKNLWNISQLSPPLFVFASRLEASLTTSDEIEKSTRRALLPTEYRTFLGGEDNLRGFARQALNNQDLGYLTSVYAGFELRLIEVLPWGLEPLLLYDIAQVGNTPSNLDKPLFTSYGGGLRWQSPIGPVRGVAALGEILNPDATTDGYKEEWVYTISLGREF